MNLPPTPEQQDWMAKLGIVPVKKVQARRGEPGKQCGDCKFGHAHGFSEKYFYCSKFGSKHTPNGMAKTKRTFTCDHFTPKS